MTALIVIDHHATVCKKWAGDKTKWAALGDDANRSRPVAPRRRPQRCGERHARPRPRLLLRRDRSARAARAAGQRLVARATARARAAQEAHAVDCCRVPERVRAALRGQHLGLRPAVAGGAAVAAPRGDPLRREATAERRRRAGAHAPRRRLVFADVPARDDQRRAAARGRLAALCE